MPGQLSRISGLLPGPPGACANALDVGQANAKRVKSHTRTIIAYVHKKPAGRFTIIDDAQKKTPARAGVFQISARSVLDY
jgi:hypothetical protein